MSQPSTPGDGSYPLAAQIPLQSFKIPIFPPQASRLRELTLTSDIKLDEYQELLQKHMLEAQSQEKLAPNTHARRSSDTASASLQFHTPNLPATISSLTLELFSLGFPAQWLRSIGRSLHALKSLVMFNCLIDGISEESREDAGFFFSIISLRDLHIIDSFARPGFWNKLAEDIITRSATGRDNSPNGKSDQKLRFLEISYTYRGHSDPDFMTRLCGEELPELLTSGLMAASFNLSPPPPPPPAEEGQEPLEDPANLDEEGKLFDNKRPEGIVPFQVNSRASATLRKRFEVLSSGKALQHLKMLNLSMWTLRPEEVGQILYACASGGSGSLADLCVCVSLDEAEGDLTLDWWDEILKSLTDKSQDLEGLEIVGVPSDKATGPVSAKLAGQIFEKTKDLEKLKLACPKLVKFEMNILRAGSFGRVEWIFDEELRDWSGGITPGEAQNGDWTMVDKSEK